jgi:uncharacterized protein
VGATEENELPGRWFSRGLRFSCARCGACCTGEPGFVWVSHDEIAALVHALGLPLEEFARRYLRLVRGRVSLKEKPNGDCVFFGRPEKRCRVYAARPVQCRTYPFWPEILRSPREWEAAGDYCPGIGSGKLWPAEVCEAREEVSRRTGRTTARSIPPPPNP